MQRIYSIHYLVLLLFLAVFVFFALANAAQAATFTVTKTADTADGTCDSDCSLREAIIDANALAGADTVEVPAGTYRLTIIGRSEDLAATGDLDITSDVTVNGASSSSGDEAANETTIDANGIDRAFDVIAGGTLALNNLTIENGVAAINSSAFGGAIDNEGTLSLSGCTLRNNTATDSNDATAATGFGGAIFNAGTGTIPLIENTTFSGNKALDKSGSATGSGYGGAIENDGTVDQINNTTFSGNMATDNSGTTTGTGFGGGIHNSIGDTIATIENSTFSGNIANDTTAGGSGFGGALVNEGTITTIDNTEFTGNTAEINNSGSSDSGFGGAISNNIGATITTLQNSTVDGNTAKKGTGADSGFGGGIRNPGTITTLKDTSVINNTALQYDGSGSGSGFGGGIDIDGSIVTIDGCTISGNAAKSGSSSSGNGFGGGINDSSSAASTIQNTTISGNTAFEHSGSGSVFAFGGGVYDFASDTTYHHVTITNNTALNNTSSGTGTGFGGGVYNIGTITLQHTIIADNEDGNSPQTTPDCDYSATIVSTGYNIVADNTGCGFPTGTGDQINVDPLLNSLADNGGPTYTHSFQNSNSTAAFTAQATSPALDQIPEGTCTLTQDQRGMSRPQNSFCDVGAYELDQTDPVITVTDGDISNWLIGDDWVEPGYSASDNFDGDLTSSVTITGKVKPNYLGTKTLTYSVSDAVGNTVTETRTVEVITRGKVIKLTPKINNKVKVKYADDSTQVFTIWNKGSAKPKVKLSTNGKRIVAVKKTGKKLKVLRALTGQVKAKRKTFLKKKQSKVKIKVFNLYKKNKKNEIVVASKLNNNLKTTVIGLTKKNKLKNKNALVHSPFTKKFFKIKKKKKNVLIKRKDNSIIVKYNVTKLGDLLPL